MKRAITVIFALLMVLSLTACGGGGTTTNDPEPTQAPTGTQEPTPEPTEAIPTQNPNAIEITPENFDKYFNTSKNCDCAEIFDGKAVNVTGVFGTYGFDLGNGTSTLYFYKGIEPISVIVKGASTNFNYNDIVVTFKCSGTYKEIVGISKSSKIGAAKNFSVELTVECNIAGEGKAFGKYTLPEDHYTDGSLVNANWELVSVSGTVTPAK